jgi:hypothetical protein
MSSLETSEERIYDGYFEPSRVFFFYRTGQKTVLPPWKTPYRNTPFQLPDLVLNPDLSVSMPNF